MRALGSGIAIPLLVTAHLSEAQLQDRVYPFIELTDEMRARIDLKDGQVEDWPDALGEPTLTPLDFAGLPGESYDPSSFDFRVWLAWHDTGDHLFAAAEFVDDFHENPYERDEGFHCPSAMGPCGFPWTATWMPMGCSQTTPNIPGGTAGHEGSTAVRRLCKDLPQ